jgi:hypothetical protein
MYVVSTTTNQKSFITPIPRCHEVLHNGIQYSKIQLNDIEHNDIQHKIIQHNYIQHSNK